MKERKRNLSRRKFLLKGTAAAVAAIAAAMAQTAHAKTPKKKSAPPPPPPPPEDPPVTLSAVDITFTLNGKKRTMTVPAGRTLAEVLRQDLGLTGVKIGCGSSDCGACTVLLNGRPVYSCTFLAALVDQGVVETIEGISPKDGSLHPIQKAFVEKDALQCGFCTPGMICATRALFIRTSRPAVEEIREALAGNLCRCGAYDKIVQAVRQVAES